MFKKKSLFAFAALAITLCSCEETNFDGPIVDWTPVNIYIYATDSQGNSIISPDMPGMTLTFQGETYTVQDGPMHSKAYLAQMYGLYTQVVDTTASPRQYKLCFGEIDGAKDMDEDITLNWPDGTTDVIHYHCSDHNESKITVKRSWKLNGAKHEGSTFRFTNKSLN
jgi:hypothetical protein